MRHQRSSRRRVGNKYVVVRVVTTFRAKQKRMSRRGMQLLIKRLRIRIPLTRPTSAGCHAAVLGCSEQLIREFNILNVLLGASEESLL